VRNFASVADAVRCAVEVQREMAGRNTDVPSDRHIEFRMGINVGDIIRDGRDIYGDEVNVAARLEALAEPGGICVSRVVRDQVRDKLTFSFVQQVNDLYRETCLRHRRQPGRLMCSYFIHFADDVAQEAAARVRQIRYFQECALAALPGDARTAPPSYRHFIDIVERLRRLQPQDLTENSVLFGSPAQIAEVLKKVEAVGFDEVILYFNVGLKPHSQVKDEMARFMAEVAPAFT
jgi:alkanesulfonate monooxygenase SsuD/methylene tetrahydromethanopterin reductase-like flavin-dependent oxidoreductase (luciferase family)